MILSAHEEGEEGDATHLCEATQLVIGGARTPTWVGALYQTWGAQGDRPDLHPTWDSCPAPGLSCILSQPPAESPWGWV